MRWLQLLIVLWIMSLCSVLAAAPAGPRVSQRSAVEETKREFNHLQQQLQKSKQQLQQHRRKEQSVLDRLDTISRRQAILAHDVHTTAQELQAARERGDALQAAYDHLSRQLEQQRQRLSQRVRQLYKLGQLPYVKLLLAAKDVAEFARKVQYIQHLAARDQQQIEQYYTSRAQLLEAQSELAKAAQRTQAMHARLRDKRDALTRERQHQTELLRLIREEKTLTEKAVGEFAQAAATLAQLIKHLQEQARRTQPRPVVTKGQLFWPLDGTILSSYGRVRHPTFDVVTVQQGIYIGAPFGQEVRVAADGTVVYADWFKGLGRLLLVDHGNHILTLYGHTSAILVRVGDVVRGQQVVAKVGDSSALGEPALYFAVRHKTAPQDPLQWLRQRSVRLTERPEDRAGELQ